MCPKCGKRQKEKMYRKERLWSENLSVIKVMFYLKSLSELWGNTVRSYESKKAIVSFMLKPSNVLDTFRY